MSDTKLLQAILDGQRAIKEELLDKMNKVEGKVDTLEDSMKVGFKNVTDRLDKIGSSVAFLEDDTLTREEFDKLDERVTSIESKAASLN